jgi:hypothetical protein
VTTECHEGNGTARNTEVTPKLLHRVAARKRGSYVYKLFGLFSQVGSSFRWTAFETVVHISVLVYKFLQ